jgi:hypothetical protein
MFLSLGISSLWVLFFSTIDRCFSNDYANITFYTISSVGGLIGYTYFPTEISPITGQWWVSSTLSQLSVAYFVFDVISCIRNKNEKIYIFHGIFGGIACSFPYYFGYFAKHWLFLMSYEFSTIFLAASRMLDPKNTAMVQLNKIFFALSFFVFRIIFGTYITIDIMYQIYTREIIIESVFVNNMSFFLILFFGILNYYWFFKIIKKITRIQLK